ncbi:MAG: NAD(P)-binding domain-containing protein [Deltaproteobacteria bacterium]|nr:NAD(P)-binding domain-containing protein [Deltaproteobacteria bacterium]
MKRDSIAIIGLGKVGTALGFLLRSAGYEIAAVSDASPESLIKGVEFTGGKAFADASLAATEADTIFITTWDDAIETTCEEISQKGALHPGNKVVHVSGAGGLDILDSARKCGTYVASIHPLQSFADTRSAIENLPGSTFGITADDEIYDWAVEIVTALGGTHGIKLSRDPHEHCRRNISISWPGGRQGDAGFLALGQRND